ncbi:MAG: hypothetical protein WA672_09480 [Candidatus Angelobacter sp.]
MDPGGDVTESGCAACHQINGVNPPQNFAPDLTRVGSRALAKVVFAPGMKHNLPDYNQLLAVRYTVRVGRCKMHVCQQIIIFFGQQEAGKQRYLLIIHAVVRHPRVRMVGRGMLS